MKSELVSLTESEGFGAGDAEHPFTDEELGALAVAADPDQPPAHDALPWALYSAGLGGPLPSWYMPPPRSRLRKPWQRLVVLGVIATFLVIDGLGLCSTYGPLVPA